MGVAPAQEQHVHQTFAHPGLQIEADAQGKFQIIRSPNCQQERPSALLPDLAHALPNPPDEGSHEGDLLGGDGLSFENALEEDGMPDEVQFDAIQVVSEADLLDDLELAVADHLVGEVQCRGVEVGHRGTGKGGFGDGRLQSASTHQEFSMVEFPAGEVALDEAVVNVVHAQRGEGLHSMLVREVGDDLQGTGAGFDQGLEIGRVRVHVVGTVRLLGIAVDGLDAAVVGGGVSSQDRPADRGHGGSRKGFEPGRQEAFDGGGSGVHENRRVPVEDHPLLAGLDLGRLSLLTRVDNAGGEEADQQHGKDHGSSGGPGTDSVGTTPFWTGGILPDHRVFAIVLASKVVRVRAPAAPWEDHNPPAGKGEIRRSGGFLAAELPWECRGMGDRDAAPPRRGKTCQ